MVAGTLTYVLRDVPPFIETLGFCSLLMEATLGLPQWVTNYKRKSTEGMRCAGIPGGNGRRGIVCRVLFSALPLNPKCHPLSQFCP